MFQSQTRTKKLRWRSAQSSSAWSLFSQLAAAFRHFHDARLGVDGAVGVLIFKEIS
jgi:hypothetical protein